MLEDIGIGQLLEQIGAAQATTFINKDLDHRFVYVNDVFAASLGMSPAQVIGRNDLEIGMSERMVLGDPASG